MLETLYIESMIVFLLLKKLSEGTFSHVVAHIWFCQINCDTDAQCKFHFSFFLWNQFSKEK